MLTDTARQVPSNQAHSWNLNHRPSLSNGVTVSIRRFQLQAEKGRKRATELEWHMISIGGLLVSRTAIDTGSGGLASVRLANDVTVLIFLIP